MPKFSLALTCAVLAFGADRTGSGPGLAVRSAMEENPGSSVAAAGSAKLPTVFEPGQPIVFDYPAVTQPTLFTGAQTPEIVVPAGAGRLEVSVATDTPGVNVDLYVRYGSAPEVSNGQVVADYSRTGFSGFEALTITAASSPPLRAGSYFVALVLRTLGAPAHGTILATVGPDDYPGVTLASGVPMSFKLPSVSGPTLFIGSYLYRIQVPAGAARLEFSADAALPNASADIDMMVRRGTPPVVSGGDVLADFRSEGQGGSESIVITPGSDPPLAPGTYYVALALYTTGTEVEGLIRASIDGGAPPPPQNPVLSVSPERLTFRSETGTNPAPQNISVRNSGGGTLSYTARAGEPWISVTPQSGASTGETDTVAVTVNTGGLDAGTYTGSVTVSAGAAGSRTVEVTLELTGGGSPPGAPAISSGGVVNAADYTAGFAPGIIFSIFGRLLAPATGAATAIPLPTRLEGVSVEVTDRGTVKKAPLFFVSPGQINAQLPFDVSPGQLQVRVRSAAGLSSAQTITVRQAAPRLFTVTMDGKGEAVVVHNSDWRLVSAEHPARVGEVLNMFLTGLGAVTPSVPAGAAGGDNGELGPLNQTVANVAVTVAGIPAERIYFSGLAPGFVGLYQLSFQVPEYVGDGPAVIEVEAGGQSSQADVFIACGRGWRQISSAVIQAGGGTVAAPGFQMEVPAGAMSGSHDIQVLGLTTPEEPAPEQVTETYGLAGLPETIAAPLPVTLDLKPGAAVSGKSYVVVSETGGGGFLVPATVEGGKIRATLPPRQGKPTDIPAAEGTDPWQRRRMAVEEAGLIPKKAGLYELAEAVVYGVSRHVEYRTEHFKVLYPRTMAADDPGKPIGEALEAAYQRLAAMSVNLARVPEWPVRVWCVDFQESDDSAWRSGHEPWGEVKRGFWIGSDMIRLNAAKMENPAQIQAMRSKAAHMLLHMVARAHINPSVSSVDPTTWRWLDEALATWFERQTAAGSYIPGQLHGAEGFLTRRGLEFQYGDALSLLRADWKQDRPEMTFHGYGAALFIEHYARAAGGGGWLSLLLDRRAGIDPDDPSRQRMPVDALEVLTPDLGGVWFDFVKKFVDGTLFDGVRFPAQEKIIELAEANEGGFDNAEDTQVAFQWDAPELAARFYAIRVLHKYPEDTKLVVQLQGDGARAFVHRVNRYDQIQGLVGTVAAGGKLEIDKIREMPENLEWLLIGVVSAKAEKPFTAIHPIALTVKIAGESSPIVEQIEEAAAADTLEINVFTNADDTTCWTPNGTASGGTCGTAFGVPSFVALPGGKTVYAKTWVDGPGRIRALYSGDPPAEHCNQKLTIDIEVQLSDDGRTVEYARAWGECGSSGTTWDGKPETTLQQQYVEVRKIPLDSARACFRDGECVPYIIRGDVTDRVVKVRYRFYQNDKLLKELRTLKYEAGNPNSNAGVHFTLER